MDIESLRKYRILKDIKSFEGIINSKGDGIAVLDLAGTLIAFYIIDKFFFKGQMYQKYRYRYYLSSIPIGVVVHKSVSQETFLNNHLFSNEMNIHKVIFIVICIMIFL